MKKKRLTFDMADTYEQALKIADSVRNSRQKPGYPKIGTWTSSDYKEHKFIIWYY